MPGLCVRGIGMVRECNGDGVLVFNRLIVKEKSFY